MTTTFSIKASVTTTLVILMFTMASSGSEVAKERWVGHQVVFGKTDVPFMGTKETWTESFLLADVRRDAAGIDIEQVACKVRFKEIMGVKINIPKKALLKLPKARFRFTPQDDKTFKADVWRVGWNKQDVDRDGSPGLTIDVDASICSGKLNVASTTRSAAAAILTKDGMLGKIGVEVKQTILGSNSACLDMFSKNTEETQKGTFVYRRVPAGTTCSDLLKRPWPVNAKGAL